MSLWHKPVSEISYSDVDAFCKLKLPESARLDYKLHFPANLEKTIAAFANTVGGMIILGVEADPKTNSPIWPPTAGLSLDAGIQERVYQKATEAIYPPVRVSVSPVIEIPSLLGRCVIVIRVDESRDAPHAVAKGREVYVYERSDNTTNPWKLAHIDRIGHLLERRKVIEERREVMLREILHRNLRIMPDIPNPVGWISAIPVYPWRDICRPSTCYDYLLAISESFRRLSNTQVTVQRIPGGAFLKSQGRFAHGVTKPIDCTTLGATGVALTIRTLLSLDRRVDPIELLVQHEQKEKLFEFTMLWGQVVAMFKQVREFYDRPSVELPGMLLLRLEMVGMKDYRFIDNRQCSRPFLENEYRDEVVVPGVEFLQPGGGINLLRDRLAYSFDVSTPDGQ